MISTREALEIAASCLMPDTPGTSKGTPDALTMSASTLHRRKETRSKSAEAIKELFSDKIAKEILPHFLLQWDGKSMEGFKRVDKRVEKLAVVLTCTTAFHEFPEKVLDFCEISGNSAEDCFQAIANVLERLPSNLKQLILGGVFHTTALNSGWKNGVMVKLEKYIGQKLVHVYCKHHVFERICSDVIATVVGHTKAPEHNVY